MHRPDSRFHPGHQYEIGKWVQILPESPPQCALDYNGQFDFRIHPNLPDGWHLDPETGAIKGVAKEKLYTTQFVVTALQCMGADCCAIVRIKVADKVESVHLPMELGIEDGEEHHFVAGTSLFLKIGLNGTDRKNMTSTHTFSLRRTKTSTTDIFFCATYSSQPALPEGLACKEHGNIWVIPHELQPIVGKIYSIKQRVV